MKRILVTLILSHFIILIGIGQLAFLFGPLSYTFFTPHSSLFTLSAQTNYDYSRILREHLNRGVVAVRTTDGKVAVSWRTLMSDPKGQAYDIYRNGVKLNAEPLTTGGTFFIDEHPLPGDATYRVSRCSDNSEDSEHSDYTLPANVPTGYIPIPLQKPEGRYTANDVSVGDIDGDGQYEIFLKWEPWNARDNSHDGYTDPVLIDCYRLDGTWLWRINLGRNIRIRAMAILIKLDSI